ncbi:hypothetical protein FC56_GL000296 [Lentilactobacillus senioris DSM 24302 = JCM 17472]|uniref:IraD/Gp25-like domain-containing protein n=1 Tax=Lentilactobacillus senioris DSM 24302 = JCM 17472 TaxID=1423802 RepID=A0A0R2CPB6_9LACO|nr:hypothetical protein [Lentilactobacillus senioris]KRM93582.1 hypothetical protein FC56_GL000296 [Lentilactobacillus senioris DSM 24302 = JCM 17472]
MSTDVRLDENGNPNLSNGKDYVTGVDELRQSLEMRLLSQVGWAVDDVDFGVEWLDFFGEFQDADLAANKIAEALEEDDRVAVVTDVTVDPDYKTRKAMIKVTMQLSDSDLIADNGDPNLDFNTSITI